VDGKSVVDGREERPALWPAAHLCPKLASPLYPPFVFETDTFGIIEIQI
jgi:hypothetical protein